MSACMWTESGELRKKGNNKQMKLRKAIGWSLYFIPIMTAAISAVIASAKLGMLPVLREIAIDTAILTFIVGFYFFATWLIYGGKEE